MDAESLETLSRIFVVFIIIVIIIAIIGFAISITLYILESIFLSRFNKLLYGKGTALAWIPFCSTYLLGKLTFNKTIGWVLVAAGVLSGVVSINTGNRDNGYSLISSLFNSLYGLAFVGLFIYAIIKYSQIKSGKLDARIEAAKSDSFSFETPTDVDSYGSPPSDVITNNSSLANQNSNYCTSCGNPLTPTDKFCTNCGQTVK